MSRWTASIFIPLVLMLTAVAYWPGLSGGFMLDDYPNILHNKSLLLESLSTDEIVGTLVSGTSGLFGRPLSVLSFALNIHFTGFDPFYFKLTNLIIHLINGVLIYLLTSAVLSVMAKNGRLAGVDKGRIGAIALLSASLWLLHPLNLSSVLYVVQRMNILSAMFVILALILYIHARQNLDNRNNRILMLCAVPAFTVMAVFCKENGALVPLFLFLVEAIVFGFHSASVKRKYFLWSYHGIFLFLPLIIVVLSLLVAPEWLLAGYENREFTPWERLLTESRALWLYISLLIVPDITRMSLYHGDFSVSKGLLEPVTTLFACFGVITVVATALAGHRRIPILALGILFFIAGHAMESTILPLELVFEHRNYLPSYGIILVLTFFILSMGKLERPHLGNAVAVCLVVLLTVSTSIRAGNWGEPVDFYLNGAARNPDSALANYQAGISLADMSSFSEEDHIRERLVAMAEQYFARATRLDSSMLEANIMLITLYDRNEREVEKHIYEELVKKVATEPISSTAVNALVKLLDCHIREVCNQGNLYMQDIIQSLRENRRIPDRYESVLYAKYSEYLWKVEVKPLMARNYIEQAVRLLPGDIGMRLNYVRLLLASGKPDEAQKQLDIAESQSIWPGSNSEIELLRKLATRQEIVNDAD